MFTRHDEFSRSGLMSASTVRTLRDLPAHIQKDIGWPVSQHSKSTLSRVMATLWGHAY